MANSAIPIQSGQALVKATEADIETGTNDSKYVTPAGAKLAAETHASGGGGGLTENRIKKLTFESAPSVMEFGVEIGAGTQPVVLRGDMTAAQIKAALEASSDLDGYEVSVSGSTGISGTGDDGVDLYSGALFVFLSGDEPYPAWGGVKNAEVQSFVVESGDGGNYTLNGGANFVMGATAATVQSNQRALGGDYANVVVKGGSDPQLPISYLVESCGNPNGIGLFAENGTLNGAPQFSNGTWEMRKVSADQWHFGPALYYWYGTPAPSAPPLTGWITNYGMGFEAIDPPPTLIAIIAPPPTAAFNSYFPYNTGNVANPSATGTDATASTLHQGGSESTIVTAADATTEELILLAQNEVVLTAEKRLSANVTTTVTTAADIAGMSFEIGANETWEFDFLLFNGCSATGGLKYALSFPAGASLRAVAEGMAASATARTSAVITASDTLTIAFNTVSNQNGFTRISGTIANAGVAGAVQLRFASTTASQTSTIYEGSKLIARKI